MQTEVEVTAGALAYSQGSLQHPLKTSAFTAALEVPEALLC